MNSLAISQAQQLSGIVELLAAAESDVSQLADGCEARRRSYLRAAGEVESPSRLTIRSSDHVLQSLAAALGVAQKGKESPSGAEGGNFGASVGGYVEVAALKAKVRGAAPTTEGARIENTLK